MAREAQLASVTAELDSWASRTVKGYDEVIESHRASVDALKENASALAQEESTLKSQLNDRSAAAAEAQRVASRLAGTLDELNLTQAELPSKRAAIKTSIDELAATKANLERTVAEQESIGEKRTAELAKGTAMYRRWLGLAFERVGEDRLRLDMTHIDPSEPSRAFSFEVYVDAANTYHIEKCSPAVPGLPTLVARLNETNNFSEFVRTVRRAFQENVVGH